MHKDNTPNFQTNLSKLIHFNDFNNNIEKEKDELKKTKRSFTKNDNGAGTDIGNKTKYKYNKVTRKMDDTSLPEIEDDIKSIEKLDNKKSNHKYKIKKFENFTDDGEVEFDEDEYIDSEDSDESISFMFFKNLESINNQVIEMTEWDQDEVNQILNEDIKNNVSFAKKSIERVFDFMIDHLDESLDIEEDEINTNTTSDEYEFFGNLEVILSHVAELSDLNNKDVDDFLIDGNDWVDETISSAKNNIQQAYESLKSKLVNNG